MPLLSLCTWCLDWPPIRESLPANLATIRDLPWVECCVVDLGSTDGTLEFLQSLADNPQLRLVRRECEPLHFARAYNLSHRAAAGQILAAVDADNVIGPKYCQFVREAIESDPEAICHCWTGDWLDGTCGRLALHRDLFDRLGGYDEALERIGNQDLDLRDRAQAMGARYVLSKDPAVVGHAIFTRHEEKMQHLAGVDYPAANQANARKSQENLRKGWLRANAAE